TQQLVLKVLNKEHPSPESMAQFELEYSLTRGLGLPGVIRAYDLQRHNNSLVMIVEDFGGDSLDRHITSGPLSIDEFLHVAIEAADGLSQLHGRHIMHKDVTSANIVWNARSGVVKIIDLGISSPLEHERSEQTDIEHLEGTLPYLSPEQTGRMNFDLDYRTDLYSLGVTLFEILTGRLPFPADRPLELIHNHIAVSPPLMHEIRPDVPPALSEIVFKLMSKDPEQRYQSATGLRLDLEQCRKQWREHRRMERFDLGQMDDLGRFRIPQKLYGREQESQHLRDALGRVSDGGTELLLIGGRAGVGKTALVHALRSTVLERGGHFISGKYDQFRRDIPNSAIMAAMGDLFHGFLMEDEQGLSARRERILKAVGDVGGVLTDVIPGYDTVMGPQKPVTAPEGKEAANQLQYLVGKILNGSASPEQPLVLFVDDLQWADLSSITFLQALILQEKPAHCLIIGAYRDNEVGEGHSLLEMVREIEALGTGVVSRTLLPPSKEAMGRMIADVVRSDPESARSLVEITLTKTHGNPFFLGQFLKTLHTDGRLRFSEGAWVWDVETLSALNVTDNVADLMAERVALMSESTRRVLQLASCIGGRFDLETLAILHGTDTITTAEALWPALEQEIILPLDQNHALARHLADGRFHYRFIHDKAQQAAYETIPEAERQTHHLTVGTTLLENSDDALLETRLFDIIGHLNQAIPLIRDDRQRKRLAELNLKAGDRASRSASFDTAYARYSVGLSLLDKSAWESDYALMAGLHAGLTRSGTMLDQVLDGLQDLMDEVLERYRTPLEKANHHLTLMRYYIDSMQVDMAIPEGMNGLKVLGYTVSEKALKVRSLLAIVRLRSQLTTGKLKTLSKLPVMTDPTKILAMKLLSFLFLSDLRRGGGTLAPLILKLQIDLTLKYGIAPSSAHAFALYGALLCGPMKRIEQGYLYGKFALSLAEEDPIVRQFASVNHIYCFMILATKEPLKNALPLTHRAIQVGRESGDYDLASLLFPAFMFLRVNGDFSLDQAAETIHSFDIEFAHSRGANFKYTELIRLFVDLLRMESGTTPAIEQFVEQDPGLMALIENTLDIKLSYLFLRVKLLHTFGLYEEALELADELEKRYRDFGLLFAGIPIAYMFISLLRLAHYPNASPREQRRLMKGVNRLQKSMKRWARHAPMNYRHKYLIVEAERRRVLGKHKGIRDLYEEAVALARNCSSRYEECVILETTGRYYHERGWAHLAERTIRDACIAYKRWGARPKVTQMESLYPEYLPIPDRAEGSISINRSSTTRSGTIPVSAQLDLESVIRASATLFGEDDLATLLTRMMHLALENAGAERGVLVLRQGERWLIEAEIAESGKEVRVLESLPLSTLRNGTPIAPVEIVHYVIRSGENIVLEDAGQENRFANTSYVTGHGCRSLLCVPLSHHADVVGSMVLENRQLTGAFTANRVEMMRLIGALAALSIHNARHLEALKRAESRNREMALHMDSTRESEKKRIAGEVHDELGSMLTKLSMDISWLRKHTPERPAKLDRHLEEVEDGVQAIGKSVRRIARSLRPKVLDEFGLTAALEWLVQETNNHGPLTVRWASTPPEVMLDDDGRTTLFRICQESLTNTIRHADATEATLSLQMDTNAVTLEVSDNGRGLDPAILEERQDRFGIDGMRQRAEHRGGRLDLSPAPEGGLRVRVRLPLTGEQQESAP
ncbi:MAG: AAA family ATPase, partial [Magnetococcales bacterium]|nr:AAA family ATPase [Magnetococcales bacterium]